MIFVDTWAWVALADRRDAYHARAVAAHHELQAQRRPYVTSDFVLGETISYLFDALPAAQADAFVQAVIDACDRDFHKLIHVVPDQFRAAWALRKRYHDKPDISFVDFTSMVVMRDLGIVDVFSGDGHFVQVGMGFRLVP